VYLHKQVDLPPVDDALEIGFVRRFANFRASAAFAKYLCAINTEKNYAKRQMPSFPIRCDETTIGTQVANRMTSLITVAI